MAKYTEQEFAEKVDWEGGAFEAFVYGLRHADLKDTTSELALAWKEFEEACAEVEPLLDRVNELLWDNPFDADGTGDD